MGDKSRHITYFKVENFKRFEFFEMRDIGQFNLIVGDNNVGKTSVLEALLFDLDPYKFLRNLFGALTFRKLKQPIFNEDLELYLNRKEYLTNENSSITFLWKDFSADPELRMSEFVFTLNKIENRIYYKRKNQGREVVHVQSKEYTFFYKDQYTGAFNEGFPFVPFYKGHDEDLTRFYSLLQRDRDLKKYFIKGLKIITPDLEDIELSSPYSGLGPHLIAYRENLNYSLPLALFGDGTLKVFRLLAEIILNRGSRLMIDEIDTGIHFSRFKEFWKVVLTAAKENDVQLFMTTHNEECIKYFKEVLENDLPELKEDVRSISLVENHKTKQVFSFTYSFEEFESNVNLGNEIRG